MAVMDMPSFRVFIYILTVYNYLGLAHMAMILEKIHFHEVIALPPFPSNDTSVFQTLVNVSIQKCVDECKRLRVCAFINYHVHKHQCHMIKSTDNHNVQVINSPGDAYGKRTEWNLSEVFQGCSTCAETERCDFEGGTVCGIEACGQPPSEQDAVLYGNNYRTGDTLLYKCSDNMTMDSGSISDTTCQNNGQWSFVNITCTDDSSSSCPATFQEAVLSDGTDFAYLITTVQMNHADALEYCQDQCGQLVEVITQAKFNFLKDMLLSQSVDIDYYINGNYDSTTNKFITSSGIEIPFSYSMWESSPAYFSTSQACIRMQQGAQYKINTHQCSAKYGVICERP